MNLPQRGPQLEVGRRTGESDFVNRACRHGSRDDRRPRSIGVADVGGKCSVWLDDVDVELIERSRNRRLERTGSRYRDGKALTSRTTHPIGGAVDDAAISESRTERVADSRAHRRTRRELNPRVEPK